MVQDCDHTSKACSYWGDSSSPVSVNHLKGVSMNINTTSHRCAALTWFKFKGTRQCKNQGNKMPFVCQMECTVLPRKLMYVEVVSLLSLFFDKQGKSQVVLYCCKGKIQCNIKGNKMLFMCLMECTVLPRKFKSALLLS